MVSFLRSRLLQFSLAILIPASLFAQDFTAPAAQLATRITERVAPASASVAFRDISSIGPTNASLVRSNLLRELQARGWKTQETGQGESAIAITLAENYRAYVWTAEIVKGGVRQTVIVEFTRPQDPAIPAKTQIALARTLLITSEQPLLDALLLEGKINDGAHLLALTSTAVRVYQFESSTWRLLQEFQFNHTLAARDPQGRLVLNSAGSFDVFLPGMHCTGTTANALSVNCVDSDDPWPISDDRRTLAFYAANRNYFNGVISGGGGQSVVNPFFSAAVLGETLIYAAINGHALIAQNGHPPSTLPVDWGNNIAAIQGVCQADLVLATGTSDFTQPDSVVAFRAAPGGFSPASEAVSFAGPILNLKTTADRQQAIAISQSSGRYEAYLLTPRCGS